MSAQEIGLALSWLNSTLSGDSTLTSEATGGVHRGQAPDGSATPYVIFGFQQGSDITTMNGVRVIVTALFQVKAIGPVDVQAAIVSAANQIDTLMGGEDGLRNIAISGGYIYGVWRQSPVWVDEPPINAQAWCDVGGLYWIQLSQAS